MRQRSSRIASPTRAAAGAALALLLSACGRTQVQHPVERIEPVLQVLEVPYTVAPEKPAAEDPPWYRELYVELESAPKDKASLQMSLETLRGPAYKTAFGLLEEIRDALRLEMPENCKAVLLKLEFGGLKAERNGALPLIVELGLRDLYVRRDEVVIRRMYLEPALTRLALQAGLRHAQNKTANPVVDYERRNVSVLEAIDEILKEHGFKRRLSGVGARVSLDAKTFPTREAFVRAAVKNVLEGIRQLEIDVPALIVYQGQEKKGALPPEADTSGDKRPDDDEEEEPVAPAPAGKDAKAEAPAKP
ncbi:MAG: hypothetical protein M5U26_00670 [Planctomycetota bacterium]|nr:hypothetical protein [Planctomycetota bacterium]